MENDIKPGDTVRLKSGGPTMTVTGVDTPQFSDEIHVWCTWFVGNKSHTGDFPMVAVEKITVAKSSVSFARIERD